MKKIFTIPLFFLTISLFSQENVCDCVDVTIEMMQSIERGATEKTVEKRFEKEIKKCDELSANSPDKFQKDMASCKKFSKLIQLMAGGDSNVKPDEAVCMCVDHAIEQLKRGETNSGTEKKLEKERQKKCEELNEELGEAQFGLQMMNCENFGVLMELLMNEEK